MQASVLNKVVAFAAIYVIWGSTYLAIRVGIETMPPFLMAGIRFAVAGLLLYAWARVRGAPRPTASNWRSATLIGALLMFGGNGLVTWAEQTVPSGLAAVLVATVPLWMTVLERLFFGGPRLGARVIGGIAGSSTALPWIRSEPGW
jgi:drug/metabolite transporter (DMT)-like permease